MPAMSDQTIDPQKFDFVAHEQAAVNAYLKVHLFWADVAGAVGRVIEQAIKSRAYRFTLCSSELRNLVALVAKRVSL